MQGKTEKEREKKRVREQDHREEAAGEKGFCFLDPDLKLRRPQQQDCCTSDAPSLCLDFPHPVIAKGSRTGFFWFLIWVPLLSLNLALPGPFKVWRHTFIHLINNLYFLTFFVPRPPFLRPGLPPLFHQLFFRGEPAACLSLPTRCCS